MQVSHRFSVDSAVFDDDNLVSCAGLVPVMTLAERTGMSDLLAQMVYIAAPRNLVGLGQPRPQTGHPDRRDARGSGLDRRRRGVAQRRDEDPVRRGVCALDDWNPVAGVHLRPCPSAGVGAGRTSGGTVCPRRSATRARSARIRRHRLIAAPGLRARQTGRELRAHQDRRQAGPPQGPVPAARRRSAPRRPRR